MLADCGDDIGKRPVVRIVIERVIGGQKPDVKAPGNCGENGEVVPVETVIAGRQAEIEPVARGCL